MRKMQYARCNMQDGQTSWTGKLNRPAERTSWTDQLDRPAEQTSWTDQFFSFEALTSLHIQRFSFLVFTLLQLPSLTKALFSKDTYVQKAATQKKRGRMLPELQMLSSYAIRQCMKSLDFFGHTQHNTRMHKATW